jgi:hypothetical protein
MGKMLMILHGRNNTGQQPGEKNRQSRHRQSGRPAGIPPASGRILRAQSMVRRHPAGSFWCPCDLT